MPHHYSPLSFTYQSPRYTTPSHTHRHTRLHSGGKVPPWKEMPTSGDLLNISSRVPSEGASPPPPQDPSTDPLQRQTLQPAEIVGSNPTGSMHVCLL
jgi:hypothetical protein